MLKRDEQRQAPGMWHHNLAVSSQATLAAPPPVLQSMMTGVYDAYLVTVAAYFGVAISGYAAFGNAVNADVLLSVQHPARLVRLANFFVVVHLAASCQARHLLIPVLHKTHKTKRNVCVIQTSGSWCNDAARCGPASI